MLFCFENEKMKLMRLVNKITLWLFLGFLFITLVFLFNVPIAQAITIREVRAQILKLQSQMSQLQKQLTEVQPRSAWCHDFLADLKYQQKDEKVKALQIALKREGLFKGPASGYFGPLTFQSVKLFQKKYKKEILEPWGFKKETGLVGPTTRAKLNELYGCTKISIAPILPQPGDGLVIKIKTNLPREKIRGTLGKKEIHFFPQGEDLIGVVGISVKEKPGQYNLTINFPDDRKYKTTINIIKRKFPITELVVSKELKEKGQAPAKIKEGIAQENLKLKEILNIFTPKAYFDQPFVYPLDKIKDVGAFGNVRKNGEIELQHLGVDLQAEIGTPVYAINDGLVRLTENLLYYGKTIVIDHGLGIFSLYLHLDEFKVSEEEKVKKGSVVALSGNSGYSIEPHLHLGIKINGVSVDPLRFIETIEKVMKEGVATKKLETFFEPEIVNEIVKWGHQISSSPRLVDTIIIHSSYNALGKDPYSVDGVLQEYKMYGVAPHYLIDRHGTTYQLVEDKNIAYHAGVSKMPDGRINVNEFSIGIELIYQKNESPNESQYQSLAKLVKYLQQKYNIALSNILGHKDIAPSLKEDPWNFNWQKFYEIIR